MHKKKSVEMKMEVLENTCMLLPSVILAHEQQLPNMYEIRVNIMHSWKYTLFWDMHSHWVCWAEYHLLQLIDRYSLNCTLIRGGAEGERVCVPDTQLLSLSVFRLVHANVKTEYNSTTSSRTKNIQDNFKRLWSNFNEPKFIQPINNSHVTWLHRVTCPSSWLS